MPSKPTSSNGESKRKIEVMLDSGAYSYWSRNDPNRFKESNNNDPTKPKKPKFKPPEPLDLQKYIRYCDKNAEYLHSYVNMDVIPGIYGQERTQAQVEESARKGYENLQEMKRAGLKPIPVFHQGERLYWLEKMLDDGEDYIGLSSVKESNSPEQLTWLDQIFSMITDKDGWPCIRTHGFGITNPPLLRHYPWTTTDSTTWSLTPGYGIAIVPPYSYYYEKFNYLGEPIRVITSGITQKSGNKMQYEGHGDKFQQKAIEKFIVEVAGTTLAEVRYSAAARRLVTLVYYVEFLKALKPVKFPGKRGSLLYKPREFKHLHALNNNRLKLMFATSLSREWSLELNKAGANTRLLSYFELRDWNNATLREYVDRGLIGDDVLERKPLNHSVTKKVWESESYRNRRAVDLTRRIRALKNELEA